jgi:predicted metal-binding membrane protein
MSARPRAGTLVAAPVAAAVLAGAALWALTTSAWSPLLHHGGHAHAGRPAALAVAAWMVGWALMAVAMMLPTAIPLITAAGRAARGTPIAFLTAGFLGVWTAFGVALLAGLGLLGAALRLSPLDPRPEVVAVAALALAGIYQLSPRKARALDRCRSHAALPSGWGRGADPTGDALRTGVCHGVASLACCGPLMAAAALSGLGGAAGMLALGVVMALEERRRGGERLRRSLGLALLAAAVLTLVWAV